ncbi:hypothetical protein ACVLD2_002696 [Paenibacillus sp. PvR052]|nr:hypothetical protein [Paenibacillus sp. PvP091]MBP1172532.1 hypothetical protein [Paenibacillus sp. PvR098]MBP2438912.1 hypothetical protein [Paenibacillus sp. PvP052]
MSLPQVYLKDDKILSAQNEQDYDNISVTKFIMDKIDENG